ncbi:MAG: hypothetical protein KC503_06155 [Myxococcales bacterium]|nr:hypothetical protein [Myxococcales bacterium]
MKTRGGAMLRALFVAAIVVGLLVQVGRGIDFHGDIWAPLLGSDAQRLASNGHGKKKRAEPRDPPTTLEGLPCFKCHNIGRYHKGKKFPHDTHKDEGLYHCHSCHVFSGHMEVRIRKDKCSECHDKSDKSE